MRKFTVEIKYTNVKLAELKYNNFKKDRYHIIEFIELIMKAQGIQVSGDTIGDTIYKMLKLKINEPINTVYIKEYSITHIADVKKVIISCAKEETYLKEIKEEFPF